MTTFPLWWGGKTFIFNWMDDNRMCQEQKVNKWQI